jgi:aminopeptidase
MSPRPDLLEVSMPDPRIAKLAQVLVHYSLDLQRGDEFCLLTTPLAQELNLAICREALQAGAHVSVLADLPGMEEVFYSTAGDAQLDHAPPLRRLVVEQFDARLIITAPANTRELSGVDAERIRRAAKARAGLAKTFWERGASGAFKWCDTVYPTAALAQEADMSLREYEDFVFAAGLLDAPDPVAAWRRHGEHQRELTGWLAGRDQVRLVGPDADLRLSVRGRTFGAYSGRHNFPDGEIATSPVESSANGWVRFSYPAIYDGREVEGVELWFEDGKVVKEQARKGQKLLEGLLATDAGSRFLGELGIGTNTAIRRFTKNMLFDEKMGGTIHLALGASLPEAGGLNESGIHWDLLCDMSQGEIGVDGELFYSNGRFLSWDQANLTDST